RNWPTLVITSIHRSAGIHSTYRAVDIRSRHLPFGVAEEIAEWINQRFHYGMRQGTDILLVPCLFGKFDPSGGHNDHFHLQVPPLLTPGSKLDLRYAHA